MSTSLNAILSVARTALQAEQLALQVAGHNLANATTEGYSRQRAELVPGVPLVTPDGLLGTGVAVSGVTRARDAVLEPAVRRETSLLAGASLEYRVLAEVEAALGGTGTSGLGPALDRFWSAWSDLSNDPGSTTARTAVVAAGRNLAEGFQVAAATVDAAASEATAGLEGELLQANRLIREIADLNGQVVSASSVAGSAPDLADRRDLLIDQLAGLLPVTVTPDVNGSVGVSVDGVSVVEGTVATPLTLLTAGGPPRLVTDAGSEVQPTTGSMGAALRLLQDGFVTLRSDLNDIALTVVQEVNARHALGVGPTGGPGTLFFDDVADPATWTAHDMAVSAAVVADVGLVVAGTPGGGGDYRPGANDLALELSGLRDTGVAGALGGRSIGAAHRDLLGGLGVQVAGAREAEERHELLLGAARERRESVSGVTPDEELVRVIQIQAAYAAAARLVGVVDEMYQTLLSV